ncbi:MAG TPA: cytochrome c [Thermoanaerobaculia bacterium]|nr:cytochrome c [Thermoanaerobaculia bacterium]
MTAGRVLLAASAALVLAGCRQGLYNQQKLKPYRPSALWENGSSARPLPAGTVARGSLGENRAYETGVGSDGKFVTELPMTLTKELLLRGQERYDIFCSPCHGRTGDGVGMVVQRGFKRPPSFHVDRLKNERIGYFFDVDTNGFGTMSGYAAQVPVADRWAIAAYVRTLQLSRETPAAFLSDHDLTRLDKAPPAPADPMGATSAAPGTPR